MWGSSSGPSTGSLVCVLESMFGFKRLVLKGVFLLGLGRLVTSD